MSETKPSAIAIIADKLWITYDQHGNKSGTMRVDAANPGWLIQYLIDGSKIAHDADQIHDLFDFATRSSNDNQLQKSVYGYPIPDLSVFHMTQQNQLPTFTKTATSKVFFAAGYYAIKFATGGWMTSFSPKLSTLQKNQFLGPFKSLDEAQFAIKTQQR